MVFNQEGVRIKLNLHPKMFAETCALFLLSVTPYSGIKIFNYLFKTLYTNATRKQYHHQQQHDQKRKHLLGMLYAPCTVLRLLSTLCYLIPITNYEFCGIRNEEAKQMRKCV